ncbi:MAG TPA: hypothetical protein VMI32_08415 [Candidatus Solibacter sp.]|nr:hypothetical protein [Candidatus Solibacter sp.]
MIFSDTSTSALSQNAVSAISQNGNTSQLASVADSPSGRKLRRAAAEFEGMLLSSLWKSMKTTFAAPDDDSGDPAHDSLDDMSIQAMSNAVGKAGGLGLGKLILKHLEPMLAKSEAQNTIDTSKGPAVPADIY